jgi:hypothetical protein
MPKPFEIVDVERDSIQDPENLRIMYSNKNTLNVEFPSIDLNPDSPLNSWLGEVTPKKFKENYFGSRPLHIPADDANRGRFGRFLSFAKFRSMLALGSIGTECVTILDRSKEVLDGANFRQQNSGTLDPKKIITHLLRDRGSISVNGMHILDGEINSLVEMFYSWTGLKSAANAYFTPGGSQAFDWHWDTHDVFVLQVDGEKEWSVFEAEIELPLSHHGHSEFPLTNESSSKQIMKLTMRKGDLLYIPKGFPHYAVAKNGSSLHLTVGVYPIPAFAVIKKVIQKALYSCEFELAFRRSIPTRPTQAEENATLRGLEELLRQVYKEAKKVDIGAITRESLAAQYQPSMRSFEALWDSIDDPDSFLGAHTQLRRTDSPIFLSRGEDMIELQHGKRKLLFEKSYYSVLSDILKRRTFTPADLHWKNVVPANRAPFLKVLLEAGIVSKTI